MKLTIKWSPDEPGTYCGQVNHNKVETGIEMYFTHKSWGTYTAGVCFKGKRPNESLGQFKTRAQAKAACTAHLNSLNSKPKKEQPIMSDYSINEAVFAVSLNRDNNIVVVPCVITGFYKREADGTNCVTKSATRERRSDTRLLFKLEEDAKAFAQKMAG